ncbi:MAG: endonuclease domain-containing protein [Thiobacillus sp.]
MLTRKLEKNVTDFLFHSSSVLGKIRAHQFSEDMYCQLVESKIESPIEDLFFLGLQVQCAAEYLDVNPDPVINEITLECHPGHGIHTISQEKIGKYRVDFLISYSDGPQPNQVVVELDGHAFHDKDKHQRAYEKARDRFLVASGYKVLHFTGSEVFSDPNKVAFEVLQLLGATGYREEYDPKNPGGIE